MKKILILSFIFLGLNTGFSQRNRVESMRNDFIKKELQLTSSEASAFFPIYNEYNRKKKQNRRTQRFERKGEDPSVDKIIDLEQDLIDLRRTYLDKFRKILPEKKVIKLMEAEKKFKAMMMKRLRK